MSLVVSAQRCFYCSRFFPPSELLIIGESVQMCRQCHEIHDKEIDGFVAPDDCALCQKSTDELTGPDGKLHMFVHWVSGCYVLLCQACDQRYVQLRRDLYGKTRFGAERKIDI